MVGNMLKYSSQLPNLPVPELKATAELYLKSIQPLVKNKVQFDQIKQKLDEFIKPGGLGVKLQQRLIERSKNHDNWIKEWWDNDAYLAYRDPVVPFVSYFFSHSHNLLPASLEKSQLRKATLLVDKILQFKKLIDEQTFPPEVIRDVPYCMNGFTYMFNNSRIPGIDVDDTIKYSQTDAENQFFVVIKHNRFYKVYHHDPVTGEKLPTSQIYSSLLKVTEDSNNKNGSFKQPSIGILTTLDRDSWFSNFEKLCTFSIINQNSFEDIFRSSFVLCLDENSPISFEERARYCWHGNGENRFFDKPLQFFVAANGASGFLGEHSRMDGTPNLTLNNYICQELAKFNKENVNTSSLFQVEQSLPSSDTEELKFDISNDVRKAIDQAKVSFQDVAVSGHLLKVWRYQGYGKNLIKKFNASPDAYIQLLMQLAYYKYTGTLKPTYESASTRKYKFGRTETNRTVSTEALNFVKTFQSDATIDSKIQSFRAALDQQNKYIKLASNATAVDRHIYGLKKLLEPGEQSAFLEDAMTKYSSTWYLSTSQLSSEYFNGYGWSEVHEIGLGLPYMINKDWLNITITCRKNNPAGLDPAKMHYYLTEAADELREVLGQHLKSKL